MNRQRSEQLLAAAAEAFADGRSPFETEWLSDHDVTFTECMDLSDEIARVLKAYVGAPSFLKEVFPTFDSDLSEAVKESTLLHYAQSRMSQRALKGLQQINAKG